ncbi:MAG: hypothetical protein M1365_14645 [Actinobacteria bacterium]|nr:hypothetical protein [Actinomycetota bacterium]
MKNFLLLIAYPILIGLLAIFISPTALFTSFILLAVSLLFYGIILIKVINFPVKRAVFLVSLVFLSALCFLPFINDSEPGWYLNLWRRENFIIVDSLMELISLLLIIPYFLVLEVCKKEGIVTGISVLLMSLVLSMPFNIVHLNQEISGGFKEYSMAGYGWAFYWPYFDLAVFGIIITLLSKKIDQIKEKSNEISKKSFLALFIYPILVGFLAIFIDPKTLFTRYFLLSIFLIFYGVILFKVANLPVKKTIILILIVLFSALCFVFLIIDPKPPWYSWYLNKWGEVYHIQCPSFLRSIKLSTIIKFSPPVIMKSF